MPRHPYRFRGSIAPTEGVKRPVRAQILVIDGEDSKSAEMHLDDVIDSWGGDWGISAREFTVALADLSSVENITLKINSPGGEVYEGVAILNALRNHPAKITAHVTGLAASAASFIAAGADEVVMGQNTQLMIHDAWGIALGPAKEMHDAGDRLDKISNNIADVYAKKSGVSVADMRAAMLAETWYSAEEAVAAGLADRVDGDGAADLNAFDLSVFKNQGRGEAPAPKLPVPSNTPDPAKAKRMRELENRFRAQKMKLAA